VRREILSVLFSRPDQAPKLLDRLEKGEIRVVELEAGHRDQLLKHASGTVRERARTLLASKGSAELDEMIEKVTAKVLPLKGDRAAGEKVYMTTCATCHRLHGQGFDVGPGLSAVAGRDRRALLTDILNPNRAIDPKFQQYVVKTSGQAMITGIVRTETPASITLRRAQADETTILRQDIAEIKAWPASMMPEGLQDALSAQNFADLLEFLGAK
jgi:putative heme-binding domain-containing protein